MGDAAADPEAIVDAAPPLPDDTALPRLEELLPGAESLAVRLAAHEAATRIPSDFLGTAAKGLFRLLRQRAVEDLELPIRHALELTVVERPDEAWHSILDPGRLTLNGRAAWTADRLVREISSQAYPGRHLARLMRPPAPEWAPSPETTVDCGLAAVGREILLADHELAHELERIGRAGGVRWNGAHVIAVGRARSELASSFAAAALAAPTADVRHDLHRLGLDPTRADGMVTRWRNPLARAQTLARAAGPPLVREWLVSTGQTAGLQRLLSERMVPSMLREDTGDVAS